MRPRFFLPLLSLALIFSFSLISIAQNDDEDRARGTFIGTRPVKNESEAANAHTKSINRTNKTKPGKKNNTPKETTSNPTTTNSPTETTSNKEKRDFIGKNDHDKAAEKVAVGLGYTLYKRNEKDQPVSVDPQHEFHNGDALRITLEPNINGYLYIFHTENNGKPKMLFPDARLFRGNNAVRAHVPYEVPSSLEQDARLRWFFFSGEAATEHVYVVVTRQPIQDVPTNEDLVKYCAEKGDCPWQPSSIQWAGIVNLVNKEQIVSKSKTFGNLQSQLEKDLSLKREFGLPVSAPYPSIIRINNSVQPSLLVTSIDLIHK